MNILKSLLLILLVISSLISCGEQKEAEEDIIQGNPNNYTWVQPMKTPQTYSEEEMQIASSVCQALQQKRGFISSRGQLEMDFNVSERNCGVQTNIDSQATGIMQARRDGSLRLASRTRGVSLYEDVLSDRHPKIKDFCDLVLRGEAPSNTRQDGTSLRVQVNFFRQANYNWIQIAEFRKEGDNFFPYLIERASVFTSLSSSNPNSHGFVKVRGVNTPCSNRANTKTVIQEWL